MVAGVRCEGEEGRLGNGMQEGVERRVGGAEEKRSSNRYE